MAVAAVGLSMMFYSFERLSLVQLAHTLDQGDGRAPGTVQASLFVGLALLNLSAFFALFRWANYLREYPRTPQAPVWFLLTLLLVGGAATVWALATHAGWLRTLDEVPLSVHWGYIAFQVVAAMLVLVPLVLLGARWSPGYKHQPVHAA
ncbi:hypothetical protein LGT39_01015 [Demequina sp. TTPB684]|uniref:hypothetical protein n=1 Tax=unclassified Demequina TaxID=2620311 RepID=UPI001CF49E21|nr:MULTISPECIES: hypothetical protein [unclassified Demequina]MCB2411426.1 hypothetical protein [Demequina sp. TTPB684]UPU87055.1 hypothetical protein LGT36_007110 [Demequina sp. TMPB413]